MMLNRIKNSFTHTLIVNHTLKGMVILLFFPLTFLAAESDSTEPWKPNPTLAAGLSLAIPGAGQIYNRSYWKAPIAMAAEGYVAWVAWDAAREMSEAEDVASGLSEDSDEYIEAKSQWESARERRNINIWIFVGLVFLSTIDAYVDAQLYPWTREMGTPVAPPESRVTFAPTIGSEGGIGVKLAMTLDLP